MPNSVMFSSHEGCMSLLSPVSYFTIQDPLLCPHAFGIFPEYLQEFFPVRWKSITSKVSSFPVSGQADIQLPLCSIQHIWIVIALSPFIQIHLLYRYLCASLSSSSFSLIPKTSHSSVSSTNLNVTVSILPNLIHALSFYFINRLFDCTRMLAVPQNYRNPTESSVSLFPLS